MAKVKGTPAATGGQPLDRRTPTFRPLYRITLRDRFGRTIVAEGRRFVGPGGESEASCRRLAFSWGSLTGRGPPAASPASLTRTAVASPAVCPLPSRQRNTCDKGC